MAAPMVAGAPEGWRTTLDKLEQVVVRLQGGAGVDSRSVVHATFDLKRTYDAPVARVWKALTEETTFWWPRDFYTNPKATSFHIEPKLGGRM